MVKSWQRYVAAGDSSTEGLDDPDGAGGFRGWAGLDPKRPELLPLAPGS